MLNGSIVCSLRAHAGAAAQVLRAISPGQPPIYRQVHSRGTKVGADSTRPCKDRYGCSIGRPGRGAVSAELPSELRTRRLRRRLSENVVPPAGSAASSFKGHQRGIGYCQLARYEIPST